MMEAFCIRHCDKYFLCIQTPRCLGHSPSSFSVGLPTTAYKDGKEIKIGIGKQLIPNQGSIIERKA